jgi:hypothetical protein
MSSARPSALGQLRGGANGLQRRPVIKLATVSSSAWQFRHHHNLAQQSTPACGLAGPHPKQQTTQRSGVSCKGHAQVSIAAPVSAAQASPDVTAAASQSAFAQFVAVLLGWGVLAGSCYRSIPQIAKIIQAGGSAEGLSLTSNVAVGLIMHSAWHDPLAALHAGSGSSTQGTANVSGTAVLWKWC